MEYITLADVHPLWGGVNVWLRGTGQGVVQLVQRGGFERRYLVDAADVAGLESLLEAHRFFDISMANRPGVPDEGYPAIAARMADGRHRVLRKWANDKHPDFDPLLGWLKATADTAAHAGPPFHEGPLDGQWRPEGFPSHSR